MHIRRGYKKYTRVGDFDPPTHQPTKEFVVSLMTIPPGSATGGDDSCSDYDVRLVGGDNEFMGLVEACYTNDNNTSMWGPICAEFSSWTRIYAEIVCRQLGLSTTSEYMFKDTW